MDDVGDIALIAIDEKDQVRKNEKNELNIERNRA